MSNTKEMYIQGTPNHRLSGLKVVILILRLYVHILKVITH